MWYYKEEVATRLQLPHFVALIITPTSKANICSTFNIQSTPFSKLSIGCHSSAFTILKVAKQLQNGSFG